MMSYHYVCDKCGYTIIMKTYMTDNARWHRASGHEAQCENDRQTDRGRSALFHADFVC